MALTFNPKTHIRRNKECKRCGNDHWAKSSPKDCVPCRTSYLKQYNAEHKEEKASYNKQYNAGRKEERAAYDKQYYAEHKEEIAAHDAAYNRTPEGRAVTYKAVRKRRATKASAKGGGFTNNQQVALFKIFDNRCLRCNKKQKPWRTLEADHVDSLHNGGRDHIDNIQPLCRSCNGSKGTNFIDYRPDRLERLGRWDDYVALVEG